MYKLTLTINLPKVIFYRTKLIEKINETCTNMISQACELCNTVTITCEEENKKQQIPDKIICSHKKVEEDVYNYNIHLLKKNKSWLNCCIITYPKNVTVGHQ